MSSAVAAAVIASAVIGAASQQRAAKKQAKASQAVADAQRKAEEEAQARDKAMRQNVQDTEAATVQYGSTREEVSQTSSDLLIPRQQIGTSFGSSSERTGLGF